VSARTEKRCYHSEAREKPLCMSQNGGHITKQEQKTLNQQENAVSKQIGK